MPSAEDERSHCAEVSARGPSAGSPGLMLDWREGDGVDGAGVTDQASRVLRLAVGSDGSELAAVHGPDANHRLGKSCCDEVRISTEVQTTNTIVGVVECVHDHAETWADAAGARFYLQAITVLANLLHFQGHLTSGAGWVWYLSSGGSFVFVFLLNVDQVVCLH